METLFQWLPSVLGWGVVDGAMLLVSGSSSHGGPFGTGCQSLKQSFQVLHGLLAKPTPGLWSRWNQLGTANLKVPSGLRPQDMVGLGPGFPNPGATETSHSKHQIAGELKP